MRALLISNGLNPSYEAGFSNGLASNGVQVTLIASDNTFINQLLPGVKAINLRGSQKEGRYGWKKAINLLRYFFLLIWHLVGTTQTVHFIGFFMLSHVHKGWADHTWYLEFRLLRLFSRKLILTVHNVVPHERDTPEIRRELSKIYRLPDCLVVHTRRARERLINEFGILPERIKVMEHGIEELVIPDINKTQLTRNELGVTGAQRLVLFFGNVQYYKGVDLLLEAAHGFGPQVRLHIAGRSGDVKYGQELRRMLNNHPLGGRLTWEEAFLSEERMSELLSAADVLVMPYRHIDQSGVLFAALSHGVPLVAFDVGSLRDYLPSGVGIVVPFGDLIALATAIETIEISSTAKNGIRTVAERYLWNHTVTPVMTAYKDLSA